MHVTVKIPVMTDKLTKKKLTLLERLTGRDTTVIKRYLTILTTEQNKLWQEGDEREKIDCGKLDALTLTSRPSHRKNKNTGKIVRNPGRPMVTYDLKHEFHDKITVRELKECRDMAVEMFQSYLTCIQEHERIYYRIMGNPKYGNKEDELAEVLRWWHTKKNPHLPCQAKNYQLKKLPRRATLKTTVFFHQTPAHLTPYWLELYCAFANPTKEKRKLGRLWLPLNCSGYHIKQLQTGTLQTVQLVKNPSTTRWYAHISVKITVKRCYNPTNPPAVVSIDLGMKKSVTAVLLTPTTSFKRNAIKFYSQPTKIRAINNLDNTIASLQRKKACYEKARHSTKNLARKLVELSHQRRKLAIQYDHELTADLVHWIIQLTHNYNVYVTIGKLKGIRTSRRKGDGKSRRHRRELHRWAFHRLIKQLTYKLALRGFPLDHFRSLRENWTSRTCSKCGSRETTRPFQALVHCHSCGGQLQADINGALNIGFKLIISLSDETALDHWLPKPLQDRKYPEISESVAGRRIECTNQSSLISSPSSGDERPVVVPTTARNPQTLDCLPIDLPGAVRRSSS